MTKFVNPYAFVPLPRVIDRRPVPDQSRWHPGTMSGRLTYEFVAKSPVSVGRDEGRAPVLRGSSVHGALRSLHEALTDSCFRVVDTDYVPHYRDEPKPDKRRKLMPGLVRRVDGRRVEVDVHDRAEAVSCSIEELYAAAGGDHTLIRTGAVVRIAQRKKIDSKGNDVVRGRKPSGVVRLVPAGPITFLPDITPDRLRADHYVLLVTDTSAREPDDVWRFLAVPATLREGECGNGKVACGREVVPAAVLDAYEAALVDTDDSRPSADREFGGFADVAGPPPGKNGSAPWGSNPVAQRRVAKSSGDPEVASVVEGDPIFVWLNDVGEVTRIAPAQVWRTAGTGPVGERLGDAGPCDDPDEACPSCRLFGMADTTGADPDDRAEQNSSRGRVRVHDPVLVGPPRTEKLSYRLLSPKPSSGTFYLGGEESKRTRRWNGGRELTPIAGRKMYWTSSWSQRSASQSTGHDAAGDSTTSTLTAFSVDTTWEGTVTFEGLAPEELGALLTALQPDLHFPGSAFRLGGGKPYGLGVIASRVTAVTVTESPEEYWFGDDVPTIQGDELQQQLETWVGLFAGQSVDPRSRAALQHLLTVDFVDPQAVMYPPGTDGEIPAFWTQDHVPPLPSAADAKSQYLIAEESK